MFDLLEVIPSDLDPYGLIDYRLKNSWGQFCKLHPLCNYNKQYQSSGILSYNNRLP